MATLSQLLDLTAVLKTVANAVGAGDDDVATISKAFGKAKAISAQASKYIMQYPVACSDSISEFKTALAIAKQVEFDCARFYILASGLSPVIDYKNKDTIEAHIDRLKTSSEKLFNVSVSEATNDDIIQAQENLSYYDTPFVIARESSLSKTVHSLEMRETDPTTEDSDVVIEGSMDAGVTSEVDKPEDGYIFQNVKDEKTGETKRVQVPIIKETRPIDPTLVAKLGKAAPTVVNIEFIVNDVGGQKTIKIPLAFKSDLQFIGREDIKDIIKFVDSPNKFFQNLIKLTTGEINLFKDILFAVTDAKKDVEKEKMLGNMPIIRRLIHAKNTYRAKSIFNNLPFFGEAIKKFISKKNQKDLPMVTIVMTEQDFTEATGVKLNKALSGTNKIIEHIMDSYMLLGFVIIDELNDVGYFVYSGEDGYSTVKLSDMGSNSGDGKISDKLVDVLAAMSRLITKR